MTTLHDIQRNLVERIGTARVGSTLRFRLMDAADAVSKAMEAEMRSANRRPITNEEIMNARTDAGGWTKAKLAEWGVSWPPPKGWRQIILAEGVPA